MINYNYVTITINRKMSKRFLKDRKVNWGWGDIVLSFMVLKNTMKLSKY